MFKFRHLPIKWQLVFSNTFIAVTTLLVSLLILYSYNKNAMRQRIADELKLVAAPIGLNNTATLKFHNRTDALSSLGVLRANDNIEVAALFYPDSTIFVEYFKNDLPSGYVIPKGSRKEHVYLGSKLEVFRSIEVDNILFGYIYIRSNLDDLRDLRNVNAQIALTVIAGASLFAFLVAWLLSKPISSPVTNLSRVSLQITDKTDFSIRIPEMTGRNETAHLYRAFNKMLEHIESKNMELQNALDFVKQQKEEIRQQNLDITDSISSARRLQSIILPQLHLIKRIVPEAFVLFKPKDIVSGDFYWFAKKGNWTFFAAVDCVGHGIPGAMLSIVANNWLQKIVLERRTQDPSEILNRLDKYVVKNLKGETGSARSLDIALVAINFHTHELRFAGAYNPLYIIRDKELTEIKADRVGIGTLQEHKRTSYTTHRYKLKESDMLYLFSDGYADQFGGVNNKKFKYKPFRKLLTDISILPPKEQEKELEDTLHRWRGLNEQVDDITVMGIKIPARVTELSPFQHR